MRRSISTSAWAALFIALFATGCNYVGTSVSAPDSVNGEAWYVRTTSFAGLTFSKSVWYCAPPSARGHIACKEAVLHDAEDTTVAIEGKAPEVAVPKPAEKPEAKVEEKPAETVEAKAEEKPAEKPAEKPTTPGAAPKPSPKRERDPEREAEGEVRVIDATPQKQPK
jgi:hypothetical protein